MVDARNPFFGAYLFLFSIASAWQIRLIASPARTKSLPAIRMSKDNAPSTTENQAPLNYEFALLELQHPQRGPNEIFNTLKNDEILSKVVKKVDKGLYIYVNAEFGTPKSTVCKYISELYSRLWDDMLQNNALQLNCVIVGDVYGSGLISRSQAQALPTIDAIFTYDKKAGDDVKQTRLTAGLPDVHVEDTEELIAEFASSRDNAAAGEKLYFFDAVDVDIPRFKKVALGGTFDQLHNGHRKLLTLAAASCNEVLVVGITGDAMIKSKANATAISSFAERKDGVEDFLSVAKPSLKTDLVELADPFGPTVTDANIDAIVVSSETIVGARKINSIRAEKGFKPLAILVSRRADGATLSSSFIREKNKGKRFSFRAFVRGIFKRGDNKK